jgi:hypothetical protein
LYKLDYYKGDTGRKDTDLAFTVGVTKPIRDWVTWGLTGVYTKNNSNLTAYAYNKYVVMTTATFNTIF